jgi:hypothetical protein
LGALLLERCGFFTDIHQGTKVRKHTDVEPSKFEKLPFERDQGKMES